MLKNVVLPAPLGPMIETIERSGRLNETSLTAVRPPNCLVMLLASRIAALASDGAGVELCVALMLVPCRGFRPSSRRGPRAPSCDGGRGAGPADAGSSSATAGSHRPR